MYNEDFGRIALSAILKGLFFSLLLGIVILIILNDTVKDMRAYSELSFAAWLMLWLIDGAITFFVMLRMDRHARVQTTRSTILHGMGYDSVNPKECGIAGRNDTAEHLFIIKPLEAKTSPPPTTNTD